MLKLKNYRMLTFPLGMIIISLSLFGFPNIVYFQASLKTILIPYSLTCRLFFSLILLGLAIVRKKSKSDWKINSHIKDRIHVTVNASKKITTFKVLRSRWPDGGTGTEPPTLYTIIYKVNDHIPIFAVLSIFCLFHFHFNNFSIMSESGL